MRIIMFAALAITGRDGYHTAMPCSRLEFFMGGANMTLQLYPDCAAYFSGEDPSREVAVAAMLTGHGGNAMSAVSVTFGASFWLALALHAIGVEIYVSGFVVVMWIARDSKPTW